MPRQSATPEMPPHIREALALIGHAKIAANQAFRSALQGDNPCYVRSLSEGIVALDRASRFITNLHDWGLLCSPSKKKR